MTGEISRRTFLASAPLAMAGCAAHSPTSALLSETTTPPISSYLSMYAAIDTEPYPVPAVNLKRIVNRKFLRREVAYQTSEYPGTIVVDPNERFAYLVMENGRAMRYGVGVGREASFNFQGEATIARKAKWPKWTPTPDMIERQPEIYGPLKGGLPGGARNPLGPRALYLFRNGHDTLYRLHGTVGPWTIGTKASSGCIRLLNQDIIDLYGRVPVGTKAVVLPIKSQALV